MARSSWNHYARDHACPASRHGAVEFLKMRCCFIAEMVHALLVLLIIRLLFIITALQMALLVCLVPAPVYHSPSSCCLCLWSCCL